MTRDEAIKKLNGLGFLTPEQLIDGLVELGVLTLQQPEKETPDEKFTRYMRERGWKEDVITGARANIIRAGLVLAEPMHPHLANALERARDFCAAYHGTPSQAYEAVRLIREIDEASR